MASFDSILINGVRSFGPLDTHRQKIDFYKPLTLIVGQNGTGKTSIIESLKYVTGGKFPPGVGRTGTTAMATFVHDPRMAGISRVDAGVQLKFHDTLGNLTTVTRRLASTQKGKNVSCKSEEGTIAITSKLGDNVKISSKVNDLNKEMFARLGVSDAILDYVIFCHQEESNWPLGTAADLKGKFDEIFAAKRYIEALDKLKKAQKVQQDNVKTYSQQADFEISDMKEKKTLQIEHARNRATLDQKAEEEKELKVKIEPVSQELEEIQEKLIRHQNVGEQIGQLRGEKEAKETRLSALKRSDIDRELTMQEVEDKLADLNEQDTTRKEEAGRLNGQVERLQTEKKQFEMERRQMDRSRAELKHKTEQQKRTVTKRDDLIEETAKTLGLSGFIKQPYSDFMVGRFSDAAEEKLSQMKDTEDKARKDFDSKEEALSERIESGQKQKAELSAALRLHNKQVLNDQNAIDETQKEIDNMLGSQRKLKTTQQDLSEAEADLVAEKKRTNEAELKKKIAGMDEQLASLNAKVQTTQEDLFRAQKDEQINTELRLKTTTKNEIKSELDGFVDKHQSRLKEIFGPKTPKNIKVRVSVLREERHRLVVKSETLLKEKESKLSSAQHELDGFRGQLKDIKQEMNKCQGQLREMEIEHDLDDTISVLNEELSKMRKNRGVLEGLADVLEQYVQRINANSCCPVCDRGWQNKADQQKVIKKLHDQSNRNPKDRAQYDKNIKEKEDKYDKLMELRPVVERLEQLKTKNEKVQQDLDDRQSVMQELGDEVNKEKQKLSDLKSSYESLADLENDGGMMDKISADLTQLDKDIEELRLKVKGDGRDVQSIQKEFTAAREQWSATNDELADKRSILERHQRTLQTLQKKTHELKEDILRIKEGQQNLPALEQKLADLRKNIEKETNSEQEAKQQLAPVERQIEQLKDQLRRMKLEKTATFDDLNKKQTQLRRKLDQFEDLGKEIKQYKDARYDEKFAELEQKYTETETKITDFERRLVVLNASLDAVRDEIINKKSNERKLTDTKEYLQTKTQLADVERRIAELERDLGGGSYMKLEKRRRELNEKDQGLRRKLNTLAGEMTELRNANERLETKLETEKYKTIGHKQRQTHIKLLTAREAVKDLQKYYNALDDAILHHHSSKMHDINVSLRQLWESVYVASDIDYIEIKADATEEKSDKRKAYNYRVVMHMNGKEMDMRGRCSAGQRVLACILIRLALAEVFCVSCGMIALDEPTTNLDKDKTEKLAAALGNLVEERRGDQSNFQMVVITHDEDFVDKLFEQCRPEGVHAVSKNESGHTRVTTHSHMSDISRSFVSPDNN